MIDNKVNLTIILQGRVMMSEQECSKNSKYKEIAVSLPKGGVLHVPDIRTCDEVKQVLHMSREAYNYLTSVDSLPVHFSKSKWSDMHPNERLNCHAQLICRDMGGLAYKFEILDD